MLKKLINFFRLPARVDPREQIKLRSPYRYFWKENRVCCVDEYPLENRTIGYKVGESDVLIEMSRKHGSALFMYQGYKTEEDVLKLYKEIK